jgi:hypothetical protein
MLGIPRRFSHFVFGFIQSGLTCAIAAAIASFPFVVEGTFAVHWLQSWFVAWIMMVPIVMFAAPAIRSLRCCSEKRFPDNFLGNRKSRRKRTNKPDSHVITINAKTAFGTCNIPRGQPIGNSLVEIEECTRKLALCGDRHGYCSSRDAWAAPSRIA